MPNPIDAWDSFHQIVQKLPGRIARQWAHVRDQIARQWVHVRVFLDGLKMAWVGLTSVLVGLVLFWRAPQAQDLFLDIRANMGIGTAFWLAFYAAALCVWALPVYVSASWILRQLQKDGVSVVDSVCRNVPRVLAVLCLGAIFVGQLMALSNAPRLSDESSDKEQTKLEEQLDDKCPIKDRPSCFADDPQLSSRVALFKVKEYVGAEVPIFIVYAAACVLASGPIKLVTRLNSPPANCFT